jgi:cytochrome c553
MKSALATAILLIALAAGIGVLHAAELVDLTWAYAISPAAPAVNDDGTVFRLPGTTRTFTRNQIRGRRDNATDVRVAPADWYPQDHPTMPEIVASGDESRAVRACALCHYPNGKGRPENAGVAGLPEQYFVQQLHDMRDGTRASAEPRKANVVTMINIAKGMTEAEMQAAARYYGAMAWTPWIRVVETQTVPKTRLQGGMHLRLEGPGAGTEPIGHRIIESPENTAATEVLRNPRSGFIAYVPVGAVGKGKELVTTGGGGKTIQCSICHGEGLQGLGAVPGLAGRSPSYVARQLFDMQKGARHGNGAALMKAVVANLSGDDMLNIAAYTASLPPAAQTVAQRP